MIHQRHTQAFIDSQCEQKCNLEMWLGASRAFRPNMKLNSGYSLIFGAWLFNIWIHKTEAQHKKFRRDGNCRHLITFCHVSAGHGISLHQKVNNVKDNLMHNENKSYILLENIGKASSIQKYRAH